MSNSRKQLEKKLKEIEVKGKILDIGGSQLPIKNRVKGFFPKEYKIFDLEKPHQTKHAPDIIGDLNLKLNLPKNNFDIVFCLEVFEYVWNPYQALLNINSTLKKGGLLYLSTHFLYGLHNPENADYLRYTRQGIEKLLFESGFNVLRNESRTISEQSKKILFSFYRSERMRVNYDLKGVFDCGNILTAEKR
jgi:SAM-dependent methyltransferase